MLISTTRCTDVDTCFFHIWVYSLSVMNIDFALLQTEKSCGSLFLQCYFSIVTLSPSKYDELKPESVLFQHCNPINGDMSPAKHYRQWQVSIATALQVKYHLKSTVRTTDVRNNWTSNHARRNDCQAKRLHILCENYLSVLHKRRCNRQCCIP